MIFVVDGDVYGKLPELGTDFAFRRTPTFGPINHSSCPVEARRVSVRLATIRVRATGDQSNDGTLRPNEGVEPFPPILDLDRGSISGRWSTDLVSESSVQ